jgi:hypothetical protein
MKNKPLKIDWDDLEDAFNNRRDELVFYLDRITGHVVLEGEGEDDDLDDAEGAYDPHPSAVPLPAPREDDTRLYVHPPSTERKIEWLKEFLQTSSAVDSEVQAELEQAMTVDDPAGELKAILNRNQEVRDGWYRFRAERIQQRIDAWLAEHGVGFTDSPPWS